MYITEKEKDVKQIYNKNNNNTKYKPKYNSYN